MPVLAGFCRWTAGFMMGTRQAHQARSVANVAVGATRKFFCVFLTEIDNQPWVCRFPGRFQSLRPVESVDVPTITVLEPGGR